MEDKDRERAKEIYKTLTKKQKWDHFWEYYKLHTIAGLVIVLLLGLYVQQVVTKKQTILDVYLFGNYMDFSKTTDFQNKMEKAITNKDLNSKQVLLEFYKTSISNADDQSQNYNAVQKLYAELAAGGVDLMFLDKDSFESYAKKGTFTRIDKIKDLNNQGLKLLKVSSPKYTGYYGIDASQLTKLKELNYDLNGKYVGIVSNASNKNNAVKALKWLQNK